AGRTPIAGAVFLHFGRLATFKFGASLQPWQHLRPNNLAMWHAIEWHAQHGFAELDFGRTAPGNSGLRRFKLGWGAVEYPIRYFRCHPRTGRFLTLPPSTRPWHARVLQCMPVSVSRLVGAAFYKHAG